MKKYIEYLLKTYTWLNKLAKEHNLSYLWVYWDYTMAVLKHRCLIRQYVIGEFWRASDAERKKRMTYSRMIKLLDKYNDSKYTHFLNCKQDFNSYFSEYINRKWLYVNNSTYEEFTEFITTHNEFIMKPINGMCGGGIRKYCVTENLNTNFEELYKQLQNEDVIIEEIITQHPKMVFGNSSVNTIRTYTVLDSYGKAHVLKAILRAGVGDSIVDNYCAGGYIYEVDINTGVICTYGQSRINSQTYIHPGTEIVMLGYQIPLWDKVLEISHMAAQNLPQVKIIGWDISISSNKVELIEGNENPDYEFLEFIGSNGYSEKIKRLLNDKKN